MPFMKKTEFKGNRRRGDFASPLQAGQETQANKKLVRDALLAEIKAEREAAT